MLRRKLAAVELKFGKTDFEKRHYALFGLMCIYGIELLDDNVAECRENLLEIFADYLGLDEQRRPATEPPPTCSRRTSSTATRSPCSPATGEPITFAEWGYLGKGKFQRRDFRFDTLTQMSSFGEDTLFADLGKHEIFTPTQDLPAADGAGSSPRELSRPASRSAAATPTC